MPSNKSGKKTKIFTIRKSGKRDSVKSAAAVLRTAAATERRLGKEQTTRLLTDSDSDDNSDTDTSIEEETEPVQSISCKETSTKAVYYAVITFNLINIVGVFICSLAIILV